MRILWVILVFGLVFSGCRQAVEAEVETPESTPSEPIEIPARTPLNGQASDLLESWPEYREWEEQIDRLLETEDAAEVQLMTEEALELTRALRDSAFPEMAERPAVRSRLKVVQTFLLKLDADFRYRLDHRQTMKRTAEAYNALREQFNRLPYQGLDPKLLER